MPPGDGTPEDDFPTRIQHAVFGYVRGQLLFSLIMGTSAGVALWIFGVLGIFPDGRTYAFAFGLFFGLMELVPYVGPLLGALPPIIVALAQDPLMAVWVALLFLALQQLEGHVVAPNVFGRSLRLNPLLVIFALLLGGEIYGFVGALIALPIAAILRETVVYLKRHLVFEPWGTSSPLIVAQAPPRCCRRRPRRSRSSARRSPRPRKRARPRPSPPPAEPPRGGSGVQVVDPAHLLRLGLDVGQVEVHDDRLLAAAHEHAGQRLVSTALISWCGHVRRHEDEVAGTGLGDELQPLAPAHPRAPLTDVDDALDRAVVMRAGLRVGMDDDGPRPQLLGARRARS